jgi:hypothetical protein
VSEWVSEWVSEHEHVQASAAGQGMPSLIGILALPYWRYRWSQIGGFHIQSDGLAGEREMSRDEIN